MSFFSVWHYSKYTGGTYLACHGKIILNPVWSTGKYHVGHIWKERERLQLLCCSMGKSSADGFIQSLRCGSLRLNCSFSIFCLMTKKGFSDFVCV